MLAAVALGVGCEVLVGESDEGSPTTTGSASRPDTAGRPSDSSVASEACGLLAAIRPSDRQFQKAKAATTKPANTTSKVRVRINRRQSNHPRSRAPAGRTDPVPDAEADAKPGERTRPGWLLPASVEKNPQRRGCYFLPYSRTKSMHCFTSGTLLSQWYSYSMEMFPANPWAFSSSRQPFTSDTPVP